MMSPDSTISSKPIPSKKKKKQRVSIGLTCNANGIEKMKPIVIHKHWNP